MAETKAIPVEMLAGTEACENNCCHNAWFNFGPFPNEAIAAKVADIVYQTMTELFQNDPTIIGGILEEAQSKLPSRKVH